MSILTPPQSLRTELVDDGAFAPAVLQRNLRDMARANRWLGSEQAVLRQVACWLNRLPDDATPTVLDVGVGNAQLLRTLQHWTERHGRPADLIGCDVSAQVIRIAQHETADSSITLVQCDGLSLPFADSTIDVVICVQALHHFRRDAAERLLRECARVARLGVIVSDLRRSYVVYWGARLLALGPVSPLSRHDGPLSVLRAYTPQEAAAIVQDAGLQARIMQRIVGYEIVIDVGTVSDKPVHMEGMSGDDTYDGGLNRVAVKQSKGKKMATTAETTDRYAGLSHDQLIEMYRQMVLIRVFEEKCQEMYTRAKIGGFLHLYVGQEAIAVGTSAALQPVDHVLTHYRDHGHAIARGLDSNQLMAELFGKATGGAQGLGGSMHLVDVSKNFWGGYAIVGSHLLMACGMGTALKLQQKPEVVVVYFGDGATNGGEFYEALNFAQLGKLPVIFVCENNLFAMGTPIDVHTSVREIYRKACAFDMTSERVDGNDPITVYEAMQRAAEHARTGQGPVLLEYVTYRFRGHSAQDTQKYRTKEEVEKYRQRDPNEVFRKRLIDDGVMTEDQAKQIEQDIDQEVNAAVEFADQSPYPDEKWLDPVSAYANPIADKF